MSQKACKKLRLWYGVALAAMTVILAALFIWQTLDIYLSGTSASYTGSYPYTAERVSARLTRIAPAFWIWVVMIIAGGVLAYVFPVNEKKRAYGDVRYALYRLKKRIPAAVGEELKDSLEAVKRRERRLMFSRLVCLVFCLIYIVFAIIYLATPSNFTTLENATPEVLAMAELFVPFLGVIFILACCAAIDEGLVARDILPHAKKLVAYKGEGTLSTRGRLYNFTHSPAALKIRAVVSHKYFLLGVRIAVGCLALVFVVCGIVNGNMARILQKAINICTECIGLG